MGILVLNRKCLQAALVLLAVAAGHAFGKPAGGLTLTTPQLQFVTAQVGSVSAPSVLTITNSTGQTISGLSFSVTGDFSDQTTCSSTLSVGASCQASITFAPIAPGLRSGAFTPTYTGQPAPAVVSLSGQAYALVSLAISPQTASIPMAASRQFHAVGSYSDGSMQDISTAVTWTSSDATKVSVTGSGAATGIAPGSAQISANWGAVSANVSVNVTSATLVSIAVDALQLSLPRDFALQFSAIGSYSDGTQLPLTNQVVWTSSAPAVATVNSTGLVATLNPGIALIKAAVGLVGSSAALTVTSVTLQSVAISPASLIMASGTILQLQANGTYSDGSTRLLTDLATWSSSAANIAQVSSIGRINSGGPGSATISASVAGFTASAATTVTSAVLKRISVTPGSASLPAAATQKFTANGKFSDSSSQDVSLLVHWTSSAASVASVLNSVGSQGSANAVAAGSATITASYMPSVSGSASLTVDTAALVSLAITPANPSSADGKYVRFTATGTFADLSTHSLTQAVTWSAATASALFVSNDMGSQGNGYGLASGQSTLTATLGSVSGSTLFKVASPNLLSITVNPQSPAVVAGDTQQFTATGNYGDGSTQDLTASVTWSSSVPATATVSNTPGSGGIALGVAQGQTMIGAASGAISASSQLSVSAPQLTTITVTPANPGITVGASQQFTASGTYTDGSMQDLTATATWTAAPAADATIGNAPGTPGLAQGLAVGQPTITAASGAITGSTVLTINAAPPQLVSISVIPSTATIFAGSSYQFTASGLYSNGSTQNLTAFVTWSATPASVVTISNSPGSQGLAQALKAGSGTVTASSGAISGAAQLSVVPLLTGIAVSPATANLTGGSPQQFTATGTYSDGSTQDLTNTVTWSISPAEIATISNTPGSQGQAQAAVGGGSATIAASFASTSGTAIVTVAPVLINIAVTPSNPTLLLGSSQQFAAAGTYSDGSSQDLTDQVTWSLAPAWVGVISPAGLVQTLGAGVAGITVVLGPILNSTVITVNAPPPVLLSVAVAPFSPSVVAGGSQQMYALGSYSDGSTQDLTATATFTSSNLLVAPVASSGLASALTIGATTIGATVGAFVAPPIPFSVIGTPSVPDLCASAPTGLPPLPNSVVLPQLPQSCPLPVYPTFTSTVRVSTFATLQSAVNTAACGTRIQLQPGVLYLGNLLIPATNCSTQPILVENPGISAMPQWLVPSRSLAGTNAVPTLETANSGSTIAISDGAAGWYFAGLEFTTSPSAAYVYPVVAMGEQTSVPALLPNNIVFDRCLVHTAALAAGGNSNAVRGMDLNCVNCAAITNQVWGFMQTGQDTQAINIANTTGPILISNNDLEATGENVILNTSCPQSGYANYGLPGCPAPSDVTVTNNHFTKQLAWRGAPAGCDVATNIGCYDVKNIFEIKHGQRVLLDANILDTTFAEGQAEFIIMNCFAPGPYICQDFTITSNLLKHGPMFAPIAGNGDNQTGQRVLVRNNLAVDVNGVTYGGTGEAFQLQNTLDFTADHNTIVNQPPLYINALDFSDAPPSTDVGFQFSNNFQYGSPFADAMSPGSAIAALPSPVFGGQVFVGDWWPNNYPAGPGNPPGIGSPAYPPGISTVDSTAFPVPGQPGCPYDNKPIAACWPLDWALVGFVDFPGGSVGADLSGMVLSPSSPFHNGATDGMDIGANIPAVLAAVAGVQ